MKISYARHNNHEIQRIVLYLNKIDLNYMVSGSLFPTLFHLTTPGLDSSYPEFLERGEFFPNFPGVVLQKNVVAYLTK